MEPLNQKQHIEDVGRILLETQERLRSLREQFDKSIHTNTSAFLIATGGGTTIGDQKKQESFHEILLQAEHEIRQKAELVLNGIVATSQPVVTSHSKILQIPGSLLGDKSQWTKLPHVLGHEKTKEGSNQVTSDDMDIEYFRMRLPNGSLKQPNENQSVTPARKKAVVHKLRIAGPLRLLPHVNKIDATAPPVQLEDADARVGVWALMNRGFVPTSADVTPVFMNPQSSILKHQTATIHHKKDEPIRPIPYSSPAGFNISSLKFDLKPSRPRHTPSKIHVLNESSRLVEQVKTNTMNIEFCGESRIESKNPQLRVDEKLPPSDIDPINEDEMKYIDIGHSFEDLRENVVKIREYNDLLDTYSLHQFIIHSGKALRDTPEFNSFHRVAVDIWGATEEVICALEQLLDKFSIPLAYIDGQRLMEIAAMGLSKSLITPQLLLSCIVNKDQVSKLMQKPGQRFMGKNQRTKAAIVIQTYVRMRLGWKKYQRWKRHDVSVELIQKVFRAYAIRCGFWFKLRKLQEEQKRFAESRILDFQKKWPILRKNRRVVVHIPSLSVDEMSRLTIENFHIKQNLQLSRICSLLDPNVIVVYVSPFELSDDVKQYYIKLLELGGISHISPRLKFLHPELLEQFPPHFSLTSVVLYSPQCLRRIRRIIGDKTAYLVMGTPGSEDQRLANTLDIPILGGEPSLCLPLMTRSGAKRFFMKADVNVAIGSYDIYDQDELLTAFARLILAHLSVEIWLLKIDYDPIGTSQAIIDVSSLNSVHNIRREKKSPDFWRQPGTRDHAAKSIIAEMGRLLRTIVKPLFPATIKGWDELKYKMQMYGIVIEALPDEVIGQFRTNIFIEPSGEVHLTSTQDFLFSTKYGSSTTSFHDSTYKHLGFSYPQTIVPFEAAKGASLAISNQLKVEQVFGYISIDFLVVEEPGNSPSKRIWAFALHPYLTDSAATFASFHFLSRGVLNPATGRYFLASNAPQLTTSIANPLSLSSPHGNSNQHTGTQADYLTKELTAFSSSSLIVGQQRSYVVLNYIYHPNLSHIQYSTLFRISRLQGVCFDVESVRGSMFLLADSLTSGVLGLMCVGESTTQAFMYMLTALEVIAKEVGPSHLIAPLSHHGESVENEGNFDAILATVRVICGRKRVVEQSYRNQRVSV